MKKLSIIIIIFGVIISSFAIAYGAEYNDFDIYTTGGVWLQSGALFSDNDSLSTFSINVRGISTTPQYQITGGSWYNIPIPNGYEFDSNSFSSQAYINVNGGNYYFTQDEQTGQWSTGLVVPTSGYPLVKMYFPYINNGTGIPNTPILTINGNQLQWTPTGYDTKIYYSATGVGQYDVIADNVRSPYIVQNEGYYRVQLHYIHNGSNLVTDTSNRVEYITSSTSEDSTLIQKIINFLDNLRTSFKNAVSVVTGFIEDIGVAIQTVFSWLPNEITVVIWAVIIIGLILGLFLK